MDNNRNSDFWSALSKSVENQVAGFLQNGLVKRFEQLDQLLKTADFDIESQVAQIRLQVGNYGTWCDDTVSGNTGQGKNEGGLAPEANKEEASRGNDVQAEKDAGSGNMPADNSAGLFSFAQVAAGSGKVVPNAGDKTTNKRKLNDGPNDGSENSSPTSPPKKQMQSNEFISKPAASSLDNGADGDKNDTDIRPGSSTPVFQPNRQIHSSNIIAKQAGIALPLIRSVLVDANLLEKQFNLMLMGPTEIMDLMEKTYFKGRLSAALESVSEIKETAENIDLEMYSYHRKRIQLIGELGKIPSATPDILLSITYLDTYIFRRLHQILTEFRNAYYLALTMDHILSENSTKLEENQDAGNKEADK